MTIKAIETSYKGYRFRSRLEARWAVFFDALKIKWEYEQEGFKLSDNTSYLPDFYLPTFEGGIYVEVKPDGDPFIKARQFSIDSGRSILLAEGVPTTRVYKIVHQCGGAGLCDEYLFDDQGKAIAHPPHSSAYVGIPNADQAEGEDRMFTCPGYEDKDGNIPDEWTHCLGDSYIEAVFAARAARFEHGEKPN